MGGRKGSLTRAHTVLTDVDELKMNAARLCHINKVADKKKAKKKVKNASRERSVCVCELSWEAAAVTVDCQRVLCECVCEYSTVCVWLKVRVSVICVARNEFFHR